MLSVDIRSTRILDPRALDVLRQLQDPGEADVVHEVVTIFLDDVPPRLARVCAAVATRDTTVMARTAHHLRGSASVLGAERFVKLAAMLEAAAQRGEVDAAGAIVPALVEAFDDTRAALRPLSSNRVAS